MRDELMRVQRAYNSLAPAYDAQMGAQPVAQWMRAELWRHLDSLFPAGARVLDFTAGTGSDALHLAARGVCVTALDISPGMIAQLQQRAAQRGLALEARVLAAERLAELEAHDFDGAYSTFAGLNTIGELSQLARDLRARLRPGARVVLHALSAFCLWEQMAHSVLRRPTRAGRVCVGGEPLAHRYYEPFALWRTHFRECFALRRLYALSVVAAPALVARAPRLRGMLFRLDRTLGRLWPSAGDFFVMELAVR